MYHRKPYMNSPTQPGPSPCRPLHRSPWKKGILALLLAALAWLIYAQVRLPSIYNGGDNLWTVPTALNVARHGRYDLEPYREAITRQPAENVWINNLDLDPRVVTTNGRPLIFHPAGVVFAVLPMVTAYTLWHPPEADPLAEAIALTPRLAHLVAALSVGLLFLLLLEVGASWKQSFVLALVFALATPHFVTHADGLWAHNLFLPFLLGMLLLVVAQEGRWAGYAGLPAGVGFLIRPDSLGLIACVGVYILLLRRQHLALFVGSGLCVAFAFVGWSQHIYANWLPPYFIGKKEVAMIALANLPAGLVGHLFSPNRGIALFAPILFLGMAGAVIVWKRSDPQTRFFQMISAMMLLHFLFISSFRSWWAGFAYGPRYFCAILPLYILQLLPLWNGLAGSSRVRRNTVYILAFTASLWGLFVNLRGITDPCVHQWNATPLNVDTHPERLWDWSDLQIFRRE